jgi:lipoate-protein ligase A
MVHCSILYRFAIDRIARYLTIPGRQPDYRRGRPHLEFLCNLELPRQALVDSLRPGPVPCPRLDDTATLDGPLKILPSLLAERFANPTWIERF